MTEEKLSEVILLLGRLDGKMDLVLEDRKEIQRRLSKLELGWSKLLGIATVVSGGVAYGANYFQLWKH